MSLGHYDKSLLSGNRNCTTFKTRQYRTVFYDKGKNISLNAGTGYGAFHGQMKVTVKVTVKVTFKVMVRFTVKVMVTGEDHGKR